MVGDLMNSLKTNTQQKQYLVRARMLVLAKGS